MRAIRAKAMGLMAFELPEDAEMFEMAMHGMDWALLVWDLEQAMRRAVKYDQSLPGAVKGKLEGLREMIRDGMRERGLVFPV